MFIVQRLLHTRMRVNDLETTVRFYVEVLGLTVMRRHISPRGAQLVFLGVLGGHEEIEICQLPSGSAPVVVPPDLMHLAFEVTSMASAVAHFTRMGLSLSDGPLVSKSGSTIAFIDAPEGYEIELIEKSA